MNSPMIIVTLQRVQQQQEYRGWFHFRCLPAVQRERSGLRTIMVPPRVIMPGRFFLWTSRT